MGIGMITTLSGELQFMFLLIPSLDSTLPFYAEMLHHLKQRRCMLREMNEVCLCVLSMPQFPNLLFTGLGHQTAESCSSMYSKHSKAIRSQSARIEDKMRFECHCGYECCEFCIIGGLFHPQKKLMK